MKVLIFEYITGGGLINEVLPEALAAEGECMVRALVSDLLAIPGVEVLMPRDARMGVLDVGCDPARLTCVDVRRSDGLDRVWRPLLAECDCAWPIAPESGGVLTELCREVESAGATLLNSGSGVVALTASKCATAAFLDGRGIAAVPTVRFDPVLLPAGGRWVIKPDDGVGSEATRVVEGRAGFERLELAPAHENWIVQPYISGDALSLSVLCRGGQSWLLSCNRQRIVMTGSDLRVSGCIVNGVDDRGGVYKQLASRIAQALPALWGYVGIDLIDSVEGPVVLEINPRLTTSYAGLSRALGINPAEAVLQLLRDEDGLPIEVPTSATRPVTIEWGGGDVA